MTTSGSTGGYRRVSIAEVRASQNLAKADIPRIMRYVFVPLSWPLTVLASAAGLSPNAVTAIRGIVILVAMVCMASPETGVFASGVALMVFALVADSVDGNLCRLHDRASFFGKYFDGFVDMATDLLFPMALALHLWRSGAASSHVLVAGAACVAALALIFLLLQRLSLFELMLEKSGVGEGGRTPHPALQAALSESGWLRPLARFDESGMNLVFDLRYTGLAFALIAGMLPAYLYALAALYVLAMLAIVAVRLLRGYAVLDVRRRSRSAA